MFRDQLVLRMIIYLALTIFIYQGIDRVADQQKETVAQLKLIQETIQNKGEYNNGQ